MVVNDLHSIAAIWRPGIALNNHIVEKVVEGFVMGLLKKKVSDASLYMEACMYAAAYLCHTTLKGNPASIVQNRLSVENSVNAMVRVLVNQCAQLCLNLEQISATQNLVHVRAVDDVDEQEVRNSFGQLFVRLDACYAGFPWSQYVL